MNLSIDQRTINLDGFAQRLRELRKQRDWSQTELGQHANLSLSHISRYERGHSQPTAEALHRLAKALDVSVGHLIEGSSEQPKDRELQQRLVAIEKLPPEEKDIVLALLDAFLLRQQFRDLAATMHLR